VASGLAPTYGWLLLARAVSGVGEASYAVVTPSLLSDCYPADRRALVLGVFYAAIPVGSALGYIAGGVIGEAHGWRPAFFIAGAPDAVLAFLLLLLTEPVRGARETAQVASSPLGLGPSLHALATRRSYLVNTAAQIIYTFAMGGLATWMPTYLVRERGIPLRSASATFGLLLVVAGFAGNIARWAHRQRGGTTTTRRRLQRIGLVTGDFDSVHALRGAGAPAGGVLAGHVHHAAPALRQRGPAQSGYGQRAAPRAARPRIRRDHDADAFARRCRVTVAHWRLVRPGWAPDTGPRDGISAGRGRRGASPWSSDAGDRSRAEG
jgi:MFS family permease